jgi:PAS domain-containing protein
MRRAPFYPEDRDKWHQAVKDLFASGDSRLTMEIRSKLNGETVWTRIAGMCFRDEAGLVARWTGSATDITERKRAEEAVREQTERLQLGQAAMRMIIMDWNVAEDRLTWSESPEWLRGPLPANGRYPLLIDRFTPRIAIPSSPAVAARSRHCRSR